MPRLDRTTLLLIGAIIMSVIAFLDYRWREPPSSAPPAPTGSASQSGSSASETGPRIRSDPRLHPLAGLRLDDLTETVSRPLFEPLRRPAIMPTAAPTRPGTTLAGPASDNILTFRLLGTIIGEGKATAVVAAPGRPQAMRLEEGDSIEAWTVEKIGHHEVVLVKDSRRQLLRMKRLTK